MKFIHILVEGQTEETFTRNILQPYFLSASVNVNPVIIQTKRIKSGLKFRGGVSKYEKIRKDIFHLINDTSAEVINTFLDYYALPHDFPGKDTIPTGSCFNRVQYLENAFATDIDNPRFIPFIMLHEFEAFVFVSPQDASSIFPDLNIEAGLMGIKRRFQSPEEINDGENTHPSRRLEILAPEYRKNLHGPLITKRAGIEALLKECRHFNEWVQKIRQLGVVVAN